MKFDGDAKMFLEDYLREGNVQRVLDSIDNAMSKSYDPEYIKSFTEILCSSPSTFGKVAEAIWNEGDNHRMKFMMEAAKANDSSALMAQLIPVIRRHAPGDIQTLLSGSNYESAKEVLLGSKNTTVPELGLLLRSDTGKDITHLVSDMLQSGDKTRSSLALQAIVQYGSEGEITSLASGIFRASDESAKFTFCTSAANAGKLGLVNPQGFYDSVKGQDAKKVQELTQAYLMQQRDGTKKAEMIEVVIRSGTDNEIGDLARSVCGGNDKAAQLTLCTSASIADKLGLINAKDFQSAVQGRDPGEVRGLTQRYLVQHLAEIMGSKKTLHESDTEKMKNAVVSILGAFSDKGEDVQNTADRVVRACISVSGKNLGFKDRCNKILDDIKDICPILFYNKEERRLRDIVRGSEEAIALKDANVRLEKLSAKLTKPSTPALWQSQQSARDK